MLLQNRCGEPKVYEQAVFNPGATLDDYSDEITEAYGYWDDRPDRETPVQTTLWRGLGDAVLSSLAKGANDWNQAVNTMGMPNREFRLEEARRIALSALGVSMLLRSGWPDMAYVTEPREEGQLGVSLDMIVDMRHWQDFRVHAVRQGGAALHAAGGQWYKEGGLWLYHAPSAIPTAWFRDDFLPSQGLFKQDFSRQETVFPYVMTK